MRFTSTFIVTPLAPYELILGVGWLEQHHALIGFRERSIQLRVDGAGKQHCIRPLARCNDDGSTAAEAAPLQLKAIAQKTRLQAACAREQVEQLYAVLMRAGASETSAPAAQRAAVAAAGSDHPRIKPLLAGVPSDGVRRAQAGRAPQARCGARHSAEARHGTATGAAAAPPEREGRSGDAGVRARRAEVRHPAAVGVAVRQHGADREEEGRHAARGDRLPRAQRGDREEQVPAAADGRAVRPRAGRAVLHARSTCATASTRSPSGRRTARRPRSARASATSSTRCCRWACATRRAPSCS